MVLTKRLIEETHKRTATVVRCEHCGKESVLGERDDPETALGIPWDWVFVTVRRFYDQAGANERGNTLHFCGYADLATWASQRGIANPASRTIAAPPP